MSKGDYLDDLCNLQNQLARTISALEDAGSTKESKKLAAQEKKLDAYIQKMQAEALRDWSDEAERIQAQVRKACGTLGSCIQDIESKKNLAKTVIRAVKTIDDVLGKVLALT